MLSHGFPEGHLRRPTSKMLQSHPSNLAPIVPLSPTSSKSTAEAASKSGPSAGTASGALAWNCRDEPICLGSKILCTKEFCRIDLIPNLVVWMNEYYIARLTVPNMFYIWSNPRNGAKEFYKILPCLSVPHSYSRSLAFTCIHWAQLRKFIIVYKFIGPQRQWTWQ